jgi:hypothetical protein
MFVAQFGSGAEEVKAFPIANPRLELDTKQMREPEDGRALALLSAWIVSGCTSDSFSTR